MLTESKKILDTLRKRIIEKEISFKDAAINFSSEKQTRNNGGLLINPTDGTTRFELTKMDPLLYNQVRDLKDNEISLPLLDQDRSGKKKYKILKVNLNSNKIHIWSMNPQVEYMSFRETMPEIQDSKEKQLQ